MTSEPSEPAEAPAAELFDALASQHLRRPEVAFGWSFQRQVLTTHGRSFAFVKDGCLVVKLPAGRAERLVSSGDCAPFTIRGRRLHEWVTVPLPSPPDDYGPWRVLMDEAAEYVAGWP